MRCFSRYCGSVLFALLVLTLSGCASKITKANFDKVQNGMSLNEVEKILGEGTEYRGGTGVGLQFGVDAGGGLGGGGVGGGGGGSGRQTYMWESDNASITVYFQDGKVANKSSKGL
jgi:hypothetical protein